MTASGGVTDLKLVSRGSLLCYNYSALVMHRRCACAIAPTLFREPLKHLAPSV